MEKKKDKLIVTTNIDEYDGNEIDVITPIHFAQQIRKYRLGVFVDGLVAVILAIASITFIAIFLSKGSPTDESGKTLSTCITTLSITFAIALLINVIFTINLNRYFKDKKWLILYIPCLVLMILFSVPQIMMLLKIIIPTLPIADVDSWQWANFVSLSVCGIFVVAEVTRIILSWKYLDLKCEVKKVLC